MARCGPLLTEAQWKKIAPLLPQPPQHRKGGRRGSRTVVSWKGFCGFSAAAPAGKTCRAGKRIARSVPELAPPTMQDIRVDLKRPRHLSDRGPISSRRTAASLNSLVNCLRDKAMTQPSIR